MMNVSGGCLCGKVRYTVHAEPVFHALCHCRDCQRFTGSAFVSAIQVPRDGVHVEGELRTVDVTGGSGNVIRRHFCPHCGSSIFGEPFLRPGKINIMAGTLDDPSIFQPTAEIFCDNAFDWLQDISERSRFTRSFA